METKKQNNNSEEGRKEEICRRRRIRKEEELNGLWRTKRGKEKEEDPSKKNYMVLYKHTMCLIKWKGERSGVSDVVTSIKQIIVMELDVSAKSSNHRILASLYSGTVCIWNYKSQVELVSNVSLHLIGEMEPKDQKISWMALKVSLSL
ncbi:hypothetical protein P8452_62372 [Trifolium repens]|nr:hypothetical protein P8452_62372 [Trifolium repens]